MSIWKNYEFIDYLNVKKNEIKNLPKGVSISTMCGSCKIGTSVNIDNIYNFLELNDNDILTVKINDEKIRTLLVNSKKKRSTKKKTKTNSMYNSITIVVRINEGSYDDLSKVKKLNMKIFNNGSIQMSGVKTYKYTNRALNKLIFKLKEINNNVHFINDYDNITVNDFNIYMINSEYKLVTQINRNNLFNILYSQKVKCSYEKCIRACVTVKYVPEEYNEGDKEVTICIFEKGSIKITGARNIEQVRLSYKYMNNLILQNIEKIKKNDEDDEIELIMKLYDEVTQNNNHKLDVVL
jgi:TATA-box binding protein (TBP) (component of TFIID and TFIIIB)